MPQAKSNVHADALSRIRSTLYDLAGRTIATINPLGQHGSTVYDADGRTVADVHALGYRVTYTRLYG